MERIPATVTLDQLSSNEGPDATSGSEGSVGPSVQALGASKEADPIEVGFNLPHEGRPPLSPSPSSLVPEPSQAR
jgi:hypothetical protein